MTVSGEAFFIKRAKEEIALPTTYRHFECRKRRERSSTEDTQHTTGGGGIPVSPVHQRKRKGGRKSSRDQGVHLYLGKRGDSVLARRII